MIRVSFRGDFSRRGIPVLECFCSLGRMQGKATE
jgi:hypothetical protein